MASTASFSPRIEVTMSFTFLIGAILGSGAAIAFGRAPLQRLVEWAQGARTRR